jgi:hypothetical protein
VTYNPDIHHRRSIRLKAYDCSQAGAYFVTICLQGAECSLGEVVGEQILLNDIGRMIEQWWIKLPAKYATVKVDEFVIMPNHFHGLIVIRDDAAPPDPAVGAAPRGRPDIVGGTTKMQYIEPARHRWPGRPLRP